MLLFLPHVYVYFIKGCDENRPQNASKIQLSLQRFDKVYLRTGRNRMLVCSGPFALLKLFDNHQYSCIE